MAVKFIEALGAAEAATQDRITIYISSRDKDGNPVVFEPWVQRVLDFLSQVGAEQPGCQRRKVRGATRIQAP